MRAAWFVLMMGCYNPAPYQPCQTVCNADDECQPGFVCGLGTHYCRAPGAGDCSPTQDAQVDTGDDICVGTGLVRPCIARDDAAGLADLVVATVERFSTDAAECTLLDQTAGPQLCVRWFKNLTVGPGREVIATGSRPLVLVALEGITIAGTVDAASNGGQIGAGSIVSPSPYCTLPKIGTTTSGATTGAGGSAGGSFVKGGGAGGAGAGPTGGAPPTAAAVASVTVMRGGCNGAIGAGYDGITGTPGGLGGGAIYLAAGTMLAISETGRINASGGGGGIPQARTGGAGGGSGGFIGLDAPHYVLDPAARIFAAGGSGASGGGAVDAGMGGSEATPIADPSGGLSTDGGGPGGDGESNANGGNGQTFMTTGAGGGGGGGGGGYIGVAGSVGAPGAQTFRPPAKQM